MRNNKIYGTTSNLFRPWWDPDNDAEEKHDRKSLIDISASSGSVKSEDERIERTNVCDLFLQKHSRNISALDLSVNDFYSNHPNLTIRDQIYNQGIFSPLINTNAIPTNFNLNSGIQLNSIGFDKNSMFQLGQSAIESLYYASLPVPATNHHYEPRHYGSVEEAVELVHRQDIVAKQMKKLRPKKFKCEHCNVAFSNNGQLKGHIRIHTGERPFKCDSEGCGKSFTRNEELTRHKRIHTGQRPHSCSRCGKAFGRKDHLKKHLKTHENREHNPFALSAVSLNAFAALSSSFAGNSGFSPHYYQMR